MKAITILLSLLWASGAQAHTENIIISGDQIQIEEMRNISDSHPNANTKELFAKVRVKGFYNSTELGGPELPVQTFLFMGTPKNLNIQIEKINESVRFMNVRPYPAQASRVRNKNAQTSNEFHYNTSLYNINRSGISTSYLGSYRGVPVTQVTIPLGQYNIKDNSLTLMTNFRVESNSELFKMNREALTDYLVVVPEELLDGVADFVTWKESLGYNVIVTELKSPEMDTESIQGIIADHYQNSGTDFVLFVGDQIPFLSAPTSDGNAPSDLKYFTMDGADDYIPDLHGGRISGSTVPEIQEKLSKSIEFEQKSFANGQGLNRVVGIASSEGSNPSDNEYILSIEQAFVDTFSYESVHFYERDKNSTPDQLNRELNFGVNWVFYMGHGSGYSWPSMHKTYSVSDMDAVQNQDVVKPIIVDVACLNGRVAQGYLGSSFANILTHDSNGAVAYYGGTVNISWHPPAIMAQGVGLEHAKENFDHLGEALLAGQLYLASQHSSESQVIDNFEWYVLQGDPSLNIKQN